MNKNVLGYNEIYPRQWRSPIFNHERSFWTEDYGLNINQHEAGKFVIFGLPKSGNVWLKAILVDYLNIPPVEPIIELGKRGVGITHRPFDEFIGNRQDFIHGVCIIRDPRDIIASFYMYTQTPRFREARPEYHYEDVRSFYYDWFLSRIVPACKMNTHSEEYAKLGVPIIRYEMMRRNGVGELIRLLKRWGLAVDKTRAEMVVENNHIDKLKNEGKMLEKKISKEHFRRGEVGTYSEYLPSDVIDDINVRFDALIRRWGYNNSSGLQANSGI